MKIGHSGRTRYEELMLAAALLIIALRTALPIGRTVYGGLPIKIVFAVALAAPALYLIKAASLQQRKRALLAVFITFIYSGALSLVADWTRFGSAAAILGLASISGYLYFVTAREIRWTHQQSPR